MNREIIARVFKERRKLLGMRQDAVAKEARITCTTYLDFEKGKRIPMGDIFIRICRVLGLGIYDFEEVK